MSSLCVTLFLAAPWISPASLRTLDWIHSRLGLPAVPRPGTPTAQKPPTPKPAPAPESTARPPSPPPPSAQAPTPKPLPPVYVPYSEMRVSHLFNGVTVQSNVSTSEAAEASAIRDDPAAYKLSLDFHAAVPRPAQSRKTLESLNSALPRLLPDLDKLLRGARVSPYFHGLYERKIRTLHDNLARIERIVSRHNFFDCETVLETTHPASGRRLLFIQGEMDVVADGSDPDRVAEVDGSSAFFQPTTSYRWPRKTDKPSPFLQARAAKLAKAEAEFAVKGLSPQRNRELRDEIATLKAQVRDLATYSFLVARADPFIVLPGFMFRDEPNPFEPRIGDYVVVLHGERAFPAILGDVGPSYKMGEGSLRLAQEINPKATANSRPVSELLVTYLVFPGTADKPFDAPDLDRWHTRCSELFAQIGGNPALLHKWTDITKPPPPPPAPPATNSVPTNAVPPATNAPAPAPASASPPPPTPAAATPGRVSVGPSPAPTNSPAPARPGP